MTIGNYGMSMRKLLVWLSINIHRLPRLCMTRCCPPNWHPPKLAPASDWLQHLDPFQVPSPSHVPCFKGNHNWCDDCFDWIPGCCKLLHLYSFGFISSIWDLSAWTCLWHFWTAYDTNIYFPLAVSVARQALLSFPPPLKSLLCSAKNLRYL